MGRVLREEGQLFIRVIGDWQVWALLAPFLLGFLLLLGHPFELTVDVGRGLEAPRWQSFSHLIGGRAFDHRVGRPPDEAFLRGFYAGEVEDGISFRWAQARSAMEVRGVPRENVVVRVRMKGVPRGETSARVGVGGRTLAVFAVAPHWQEYAFLLAPGDWNGDVLRLEFEGAPYRTGGPDDRVIALAFDRFMVETWAGNSWATAPRTAVWLTLALLLLVVALRRAGLGRVGALGVVAVAGCLLLVALGGEARPYVGVWAPWLVVAVGLSWAILVPTLRLGGGWLKRRVALRERDWRLLGLVVLAAFLLRFGGALSPRFAAHDAMFHVHRLEAIEQGQLFFEHVSLEWGMRNDPYPGAFYLLVAPLRIAYANGEHLLAFVSAWMHAASVLGLWYLGYSLAGKRAAAWASLLYAFMPIGLAADWAGIYTNLFAYDSLVWVSAALVAAWKDRAELPALTSVSMWALQLLSHFGTLVLAVPWFLGWVASLWRRGDSGQRRWLKRVLSHWGVALVLAFLLYYSYFAGTMVRGASSLLAEKASEIATPDTVASTRWAAFQVWWRWGAVVDYGGIGLFLGMLGWLAVGWMRGEDAARSWLFLCVAIALPFWAVSRLFFLSVRTMLFLLPALAVGIGTLLAGLAARGRIGRIIAALVGGYICLLGVAIWLGVCFSGLRPPHVY